MNRQDIIDMLTKELAHIEGVRSTIAVIAASDPDNVTLILSIGMLATVRFTINGTIHLLEKL